MEMETGFYGKLPSHGDFLTRRLNRSFTTPWDQWLQAAMAGSKERLGSQWLDVYLVSPIWRFALAPGICGENAWCGVLMPSVDRVGRYFPLTIATPLEAETNLISLIHGELDWFNRCEGWALNALNGELPMEVFDQKLAECSPPDVALLARDKRAFSLPYQKNYSLGSSNSQTTDLNQLLLNTYVPNHCFWWAQQTDSTQLSLRISDGLPSAESFTEMLGNISIEFTPNEPVNCSDVSDLL